MYDRTKLGVLILSSEVPEVQATLVGVHKTAQDRSRKSRDEFIESGFILLKDMRFSDLTVSGLAKHCGRSVGAFYKRFEDKEGFFRALQFAAVERNQKIIRARLADAPLANLSAAEVLNALVDTLSDIFSSEVRGVLRESLLRVREPEDGWAPMRDSGRVIQQTVVDRLKSEYPHLSEADAERKLRFCYQIVVGVLQNDLVNDFHTFSTKDKSISTALKATVNDHMMSPSRY